ncbi:MAG: Crp/Fnr family transcriptional regulator, partial [Oscillospiraceae bacterium]
ELVRESFRLFGLSGRSQLWRAGTTIFQQGESAHFLYYLKSGLVKSYVNTEDGREKRLRVYEEGSVFGASAFILKLSRESSAEALKDSYIVSVDRASYESFILSDARLLRDLLEVQAYEARLMTFQTIGSAFIPARVRLIGLLRRLINTGRAQGGNGRYCIEGTQESLAEALGVSRVTVNRILSELREKGVIETGYNEIIVRDAAALEQLR